MSAGAVRQGRVFVEIGADTRSFFSAISSVNREIGGLSRAMSQVGMTVAAAGSAVFAPIAAAGAALAASSTEAVRAENAMRAVAEAIGSAVAPAFVGMMKSTADTQEKLAKFIQANPQVVRAVAALGLVLIGVGASMHVLAVASQEMKNVLSVISVPTRHLWTQLTGVSKAAVGATKSLYGVAQAMAVAAAGAVRTAAGMAVANAGAVLLTLGIAAVVAGVVYFLTQTDQGMAMLSAFGSAASDAFKSMMTAVGAADIGKALKDTIGSGVKEGKRLFAELTPIATSTIDGVYNEIAAGDWAGAIEILWAGILAAFDTGKASIMGALDPWTASVQGVFIDAGVGMAIAWEQAWTAMATDPWGQIFLGAMDNVINAVMASWDWMIGSVQKGWARISGLWKDATAVDAEIKRIDDANANNASQRGNSRPGIEGRQGVDKDKLRKESESRVAAMAGSADEQKKKLEDRNKANIGERAASASDAKAKLDDLVKATKAPPDVVKAQGKMASEIVGTFSGLGAGQMAGGGDRLQQAQLRELEKLNQKAAAGNAAWAP